MGVGERGIGGVDPPEVRGDQGRRSLLTFRCTPGHPGTSSSELWLLSGKTGN